MRRIAVSAFFVALVAACAALGDEAQPAPAPVAPTTDCDVKSGLPRAIGIITPDVDILMAASPDEVAVACRKAAADYPDEPFFPFALGLALNAGGGEADALDAFDAARRLGSLGALDEYASTKINRAKSPDEARDGVRLYEDAIAAHGDPELMRGLAYGLAFGPKDIRDLPRARALLDEAVALDHVAALVTLADIKAGAGDKDEADRFLKQAADRGSLWAAYRLGHDLYYRNAEAEARPYLEKVAASRVSSAVAAMVDLGEIEHAANNDARALELYRRAAAHGSAHAMRNIGDAFSNGRAVAKDFGEARAWYLKAANLGDGAAMNELGMQSDHGRGAPIDYRQSLAWYLQAAARGNSNAMNNIGFIYDFGNGQPKDSGKAREWYRRAIAVDNNLTARHSLAMLMIDGRGGPKDVENGLAMLRQAADEGEVTSINDLGYVYSEGVGVEKNLFTARDYYAKAAAKGYAIANYNVAVMMEAGEGGSTDLEAAREHFKFAAEAGEPEHAANRYASRLRDDGYLEDARAWYKRSADAGDRGSFRPLAMMAIAGEGGPKDPALALAMLEKFAADDEGGAFELMARLRAGDGVPADPARARAMYKALADKGSDEATGSFLDMLLRGEGGPADRPTALARLADGAARKNGAALMTLAKAWSDGAAGRRDRVRARRYYAAAADAKARDATLPLVRMMMAGQGGPVDLLGAAQRIVDMPAPPPAETAQLVELGAKIARAIATPDRRGRLAPARRALAGKLIAKISAGVFND